MNPDLEVEQRMHEEMHRGIREHKILELRRRVAWMLDAHPVLKLSAKLVLVLQHFKWYRRRVGGCWYRWKSLPNWHVFSKPVQDYVGDPSHAEDWRSEEEKAVWRLGG